MNDNDRVEYKDLDIRLYERHAPSYKFLAVY